MAHCGGSWLARHDRDPHDRQSNFSPLRTHARNERHKKRDCGGWGTIQRHSRFPTWVIGDGLTGGYVRIVGVYVGVGAKYGLVNRP